MLVNLFSYYLISYQFYLPITLQIQILTTKYNHQINADVLLLINQQSINEAVQISSTLSRRNIRDVHTYKVQ